MSDNELVVYQNIVSGMVEGVLTLNNSGKITYLNASAKKILGMGDEIIGKPFASVFFMFPENDSFNQAVLDAIYENTTSHNTAVDYYDGENTKKLFVNTSFLTSGDEKIGVTAVMNDITELAELQDAVKAMEQIKALNRDLEKRNEFIKKIFGRYLSDDIVNSILDSKEGLTIGGKKQEVTIMFTDLRGFTAISEHTEPHALIEMLNYYLSQMIEIIQRHNGTILEFIGDAIVVVFGAPLQNENKDFDAVTCAIEMQSKMPEVNDYNSGHGYPIIEMGIGIHTGDVVLGNIGSEKKTKYDIIGKNVNLASRVETYTVGGQILISPVTRENLGKQLQTRGQTEIMPKGVSEPITIYDVYSLGGFTMPDNTQHFEKISPKNVPFSILDGKYAGAETYTASVFELSEKEAKITTSTPLSKSTNIKFIFEGNEVFAKVVCVKDSFVTVHFTMGKIK